MSKEPIWRMVQECARELTRQGNVPFTRKDIIVCVQVHDPKCNPDSINPMIQGVTDNLKGGAPIAVGKKILHSVGRGQFVLYSKKDVLLAGQENSDKQPRDRKQPSEPAASAESVPTTESELRDHILDILKSKLKHRRDIELVPEGQLPYTLPGKHKLYHASDILAQLDDGKRYVSIELKYRSAVTDQFKCRAFDALHMKKEYADRILCVMLFVKSNTGVSIRQAEKICYVFDRFFGIPVAEYEDSPVWDELAGEISLFL